MVKAITTESYSLINYEKLENLFNKLVSVLGFLVDDYEKRVSDCIFIEIPVDTEPVLHKSERKRSPSSKHGHCLQAIS